jgi:hypothetical protein
MENNRIKKRTRNFPEQYLDYERDWRNRDLENSIRDFNKTREARANAENTFMKSSGRNTFVENLKQK